MDYGILLGLGTIVISFTASASIVRYMSNENKRQIETMTTENKRQNEAIFKRLEKHGDDIVALNTKSELAVTAKDVDEKFVSKELFKQFEKHIDSRFDGLERGQGKILSYIEGKKYA